MKSFLIIFSFLFLTSCASTMSGSTQNITVTSNVQGATCTLSNDKGSWTLTTPGSAIISSSRVNLALTCVKEVTLMEWRVCHQNIKTLQHGEMLY